MIDERYAKVTASDCAKELYEFTDRMEDYQEKLKAHGVGKLSGGTESVIMPFKYLCGALLMHRDNIQRSELSFLQRAFFKEGMSSQDWMDFVETCSRMDIDLFQEALDALKGLVSMAANGYVAANNRMYYADQDEVTHISSMFFYGLIGADDRYEKYEIEQVSRLLSALREAAVAAEKGIREVNAGQMDLIEQREKSLIQGTEETAIDKHDVDVLLTKLHELVGLTSVKEEVETLTNLARIFEARRANNLSVPDMSFHLVFTGNPGTGKTTVARLVSKIYGSLGLLSKGHVVEVDRSGLVANYVGQTASKVTETVDRSIGGVLFIDEAYSLASGGENDYGREAIETLLKAMEDHRDDLVVIVAGYRDRMQTFISSNPGLRSRFPKTISFSDYSAEEMVEIFRRMAEQNHYELELDVDERLFGHFGEILASRDESFANARTVRNLFEKAIARQANRLARTGSVSPEALSQLTADDVCPTTPA